MITEARIKVVAYVVLTLLVALVAWGYWIAGGHDRLISASFIAEETANAIAAACSLIVLAAIAGTVVILVKAFNRGRMEAKTLPNKTKEAIASSAAEPAQPHR